jgi:hypothetical protein
LDDDECDVQRCADSGGQLLHDAATGRFYFVGIDY